MKRKIYEQLLNWKKEEHGESAVLIEGARRVGKSWIAEEFAKREYDAHLLIDFSTADAAIKSIFNDYLGNIDTFFEKLLNALGVRLPRHRSLIIFDEVQLFPRAREAIKSLVADGRYDYIETGSLVSIKENTEGILIPIEVKSKKRYTTNSLDKFTSKYRAKIDSPVVLHTKDLSAKDGVTYLPLYMAPCL